jgi:hypothetical protein
VQALARFRLGTHRLRCNEHNLHLDQRLCRLCGAGKLEDEMHVLLECDAYNELRCMARWSKLFEVPRNQDMKFFMGQKDQYMLSAFVCKLLRVRQCLLDDMQSDVVDPVLPQGL